MGMPRYVLSPALKDGKGIPKWEPRARQDQFLGFSPSHFSLVGLIRNLQAPHFSAQFHVVYDKRFTTVSSTGEDTDTRIDLFIFH
jgi:hypothetical protein